MTRRRAPSITTRGVVATLVASLLMVGASVAPAEAAEPATAVYYSQSDATITYYTPSSSAPLTTTGREFVAAQFTLRREAQSPFFGSTYYTVLDMTLQGIPSGRTLTSLPGSTTDRMVCFPADCQPEVALTDSLTGEVVTLRMTGIAPFGLRPTDAGTYPLGYNWTDPRNVHTEGGLGLYRNGPSGLEIIAAVRGVTTRDTVPPSAQLSLSPSTGRYLQDEVATASYSCSDPAGVTECAGPVPSGGLLDTSVGGLREFTIWATDGWGNRTDYNFRYTVVAPDLASPVVSLALAPAPPGGEVERGSTPPVVALSCTDDVAVASCTATLDGVAIASGAAVDTSVVGTHTLAAEAVDTSAKVTRAELTYAVVDPPPPPLPPGAASQVVTGGEVVTTDPAGTGATAEVPVQTSITVPAGVTGTVSVTPVTPGAAPTGFYLFGKQLVIEGPASTATDPYTMSLTVDGSALAGIAPADVQVFRNGIAVTGCTSPTAAIPDPCVVSRGFAPGGGGDALVTVRTSRFSTWSVGRVEYDLSGPLALLRPLPAINKIKAGVVVPVTFRLGGNRGTDVLVDQRPRVVAVSCATGAPTGQEVAATAASTPAVAYSSRLDAYVYLWRSPRNLLGCQDLVLKFRDGDELRTRFRLM